MRRSAPGGTICTEKREKHPFTKTNTSPWDHVF